MRTITLFICCLFLFGNAFTQTEIATKCPLQNDNDQWIESFKGATSDEERMELIVDKIQRDAMFVQETSEIAETSGTVTLAPENSHDCQCAIRFGLVYSNKKRGLVLDLNKYPYLEDVVVDLTMANIESIDFNEFQDKKLYRYGTELRSGVTIFSDDKELRKKIRKTLRSER
ncbi:hypothetical protein [Altibacter sp. HG106]|uniref:hypothetical protein n=1 Tax=Altibacter sp. HG106 TaxID=3023937 RepID=UPI0023503438|nr:hypothetical protein [Altibacter sp. HG106]MDC7993971.1 hypothetical protein [Altibacter sp. HG106]